MDASNHRTQHFASPGLDPAAKEGLVLMYEVALQIVLILGVVTASVHMSESDVLLVSTWLD